MMRKNGPARRFWVFAMSTALILALAVVCSAPVRSAEDEKNYVVSSGADLFVMTLPETAPEDLAIMCGYDPGEYMISVTGHEDYTAVTLVPAMDVSVSADGGTRTVRATGGTVGELLEELNIALGAEDMLSLPADTPIADGMELRVLRVTYDEEYEERTVPHGTVYEDSPELYIGQEDTLTQGSDGLERLTYKVKYVDGVKQSRELVGSETVTEPVDTVIAQGTKQMEVPKPPEPEPEPEPEPAPSDAGDGGRSSQGGTSLGDTVLDDGAGTLTTSSGEVFAYSECLTMRATAYSYGAGSYTSSGAPVQVGIVAALPSVIPPGTRVYIVTVDGKYTYGPAVVGDTPGSNIIDLFYETEQECLRFGVRDAYVYILG